MRIGLPRSIGGLRRFAIEIAIVVIGVLIALGAQQLATDWNENQRARTAMAAVRQELAVNAGTFEERTLQQPCIERRLDEMSRMIGEARRTGRLPAIEKVGRSITRPTVRSAWEEAAQSGAVHRWPARERLAIASTYSQQQPSDALTLAEAALWMRLDMSEMTGEAVSPSDLTLLSEILGQLRFYSWTNGLDARQMLEQITALGIAPNYRMIFDDESGARAQVVEGVTKRQICQPLGMTPDKAR